MNFLRSLLFLSLAGALARADAPAPAVGNPQPGPSASPAPAPIQAGPYLSPPLPGNTTVDSADMVPPISQADPTPPPAPAPTPAPSAANVTVHLIQLMVKRGLLTKSDAEGLVQQAQQEAAASDASAPPRHQPSGSDADGMLTPAAGPGRRWWRRFRRRRLRPGSRPQPDPR